MVVTTLTSKGQITIPKAIRESLHLHAGDRIAFVMHGEHEATMKPVTKSVDDVFGALHRSGMAARTIEEMNAAVGKRIKERKS